MFRKKQGLILMMVGLLALAGCATGRNYQADIDALNSKIAALQGQLSAKDGEVSKLQSQLNQQQAELSRAESEKSMLSEKLDEAMARARAAQTKREAKPKVESDLK